MSVLKFINEQMSVLDIPYEFGEWTSDVIYPYYVGEIEEDEPITEDGLETYSLILTGFNRGKRIELEKYKEKIKKHFPNDGLRVAVDSGTIAAFFGGAFFIPSGEADLQKIQITINIKYWKGA